MKITSWSELTLRLQISSVRVIPKRSEYVVIGDMHLIAVWHLKMVWVTISWFGIRNEVFCFFYYYFCSFCLKLSWRTSCNPVQVSPAANPTPPLLTVGYMSGYMLQMWYLRSWKTAVITIKQKWIEALLRSKCFLFATSKDQEYEIWNPTQNVTGKDLEGECFSFCLKIKCDNEELSINC